MNAALPDPFAASHNLAPDHEAVLRLDRALRRTRTRVLGAGAMSDALWAVLIELAGASDGLGFESLEAGIGKHFGRTALLGCLATLEETGLIQGHKRDQAPLLSHVRITPTGRKTIAEVIETAIAATRRGG